VLNKGKGEKVEDYRGVILMTAIYKIYAMMTRGRKEVEEKRIVPQNQTEFRKGIGTMENIYMLN